MKTTPTRSRMPGLYRRAVSRASWARHSWIRPALNLVRGFVRSPFLRLIPDPVGPQSRRGFATYHGGRPRSIENHDNYYVRANCASYRWKMSLEAPACDRDTLDCGHCNIWWTRDRCILHTRRCREVCDTPTRYIYIYICASWWWRWQPRWRRLRLYGRLRVMCTGITGCNGLIIISMPRVHRV